jgi:hypothetical protein
MNEVDTVVYDDTNSPSPWFVTEATGFIGAPARSGRLINRGAQRMRRRVRPDHRISNSIFGFFSHGVTAALYLGLAYAAKMAFGVSLALNAMK